MIQKNPIAYKGKEPYIFISYAHKDYEKVLPVISRLQDDGYRVWYDEGITVGSNWDEFISAHLNDCSSLLAFISKSYSKSKNCRDELALSRLKGKPMNLVYLDDVVLSAGMRMRYGRIQSLFMNKMTEDEFYSKLYQSQAILDCREDQ